MEEEVKDPFHDVILKDNIFNYYTNECLCDVVLVTNEKEIYAHKVILASVSMYFRTHFTTNVGTNSDRNVIKFLEYDPQSVQAIVNYIYSGNIHLSLSSVFDLMDIEELLQVRNLRCLISSFLATALNKKNCWDVWNKADYYGYHSLCDTTFLYILENFKNLVREPEFFKIPYSVLIKCLDSTVLNVPTEGVLLCNLVGWVMHDYETRKEHLEPLLKRLSPGQIVSWNDAVTVVTKMCENEETAMAVVRPWMEEGQLARNTYIPADRIYREVVQDVLFAVGGTTATGNCVSSLEINTNLPVNPWKLLLPSCVGNVPHVEDSELPPLPNPRHSHTSAHNFFTFFLLGGENGSGPVLTVDSYDVVTNSWTEYPPLPYPVVCGAAAYLDSCLYLSGGYNPTTGSPLRHLLMLREGCKKWQELTPMKDARCDHGLVATSGALYAIAGQGEGGRLLSSVERYDPSTDSWMPASPVFYPRKCFCCTVIDNTIFVVGGELPTDCNEYNERYDVRRNTWRKWKMFKSSRAVYGGALGRKVVVVSQSSGHSVQTYSTVSETTYDGGPALNHVRIRGSLIPMKLPLFRLLPI